MCFSRVRYGSSNRRPPQLFGLCDRMTTTPLWLTHGVYLRGSTQVTTSWRCDQNLCKLS